MVFMVNYALVSRQKFQSTDYSSTIKSLVLGEASNVTDSNLDILVKNKKNNKEMNLKTKSDCI
jgi:hypothetical protein